MNPGKLIVIEGTDGSGKATQVKFLYERIKEMGFPAAMFSFPQYGKKSAGLVEEYLNGKYGPPDKVPPKIASIFYAVDRYDASFEIKERLEKGEIVLLDRYIESNAGHQGGKIQDDGEREKYLDWLYDLEYKTLGIPEPDRIIILHVPVQVTLQLIEKKAERSYIKEGKTDGHEKNVSHLKNAEYAYLWLAKKFPKTRKVIECTKEGIILDISTIHSEIWKEVSPLLPSPKLPELELVKETL